MITIDARMFWGWDDKTQAWFMRGLREAGEDRFALRYDDGKTEIYEL
jgi:hypothetical protein